MNLQQEIITRLGVQPKIDVQTEVRKRVDFLKHSVTSAGLKGLLIAISGGVDSALVTALCKKATDELTDETGRTYKTIGVFQPYGEQEDIADSYSVAQAIGLTDVMETNIEEAVDEAALEIEHAYKPLGIHTHVSRVAKGNMKARMRMLVQYSIAFDQQLLVVGTDHASEAITGFYTKWGDGAVDVTPISSLNKRQVRQLAEAMGIPHQVVYKVPTAGLWPGQTDESELGITYEHNSDYLEGKIIPEEIREKLEAQYRKTEHKRAPIPGI
jgi:NAD+ synthase